MAQDEQALIDEFVSREVEYQQFGLAMNSLISRLISVSNINTHSIHFRVKEKGSLKEKIELKNKYSSLSEITDLVGVRVITYYSSDIEEVENVIKEHFLVDEKNTIDKRKTHEPDRFGYMSLHYVVSINESRGGLAEYSAFLGMKFEIQIRTILQHTWAEIEHDLGYKSKNSVPNYIKRKFSILSGSLELIDSAFIDIRRMLNEYNTEAEKDAKSDASLLNMASDDINDMYMKNFVVNSSAFDGMYKKYLEKENLSYPTDDSSSYSYPDQAKTESDVNYKNLIRYLGLLGINKTDELKKLINDVSKDEKIIDAVLKFKEQYISLYLSRYFFLLFVVYCYAHIKNRHDIFNEGGGGKLAMTIGEYYDEL